MESVEPRVVAEVIAALESEPKTVSEARRRPLSGGVEDASGLYAWWAKRGALPGAEGAPHPLAPNLRAFYVGISPVRVGTKQRLRGRVVGNHIGGNTGGSTFRLALAALLREERRYQAHVRVDAKGRRKYVLPSEQNEDLRRWQTEHLRVTWATCELPWQEGLEAAIIAHLKPPLNSGDNSHHPFHATLAAARARFRDVADGSPAGISGRT